MYKNPYFLYVFLYLTFKHHYFLIVFYIRCSKKNHDFLYGFLYLMFKNLIIFIWLFLFRRAQKHEFHEARIWTCAEIAKNDPPMMPNLACDDPKMTPMTPKWQPDDIK